MDTIIFKKCIIIIVIIYAFNIISCALNQHLEHKSEEFYELVKSENKIKIYDIIHHNLPSVRNLARLSDIIVCLSVLIIGIIDLNLFFQLIGYLITILVVRLFTIHLTILPKDKKCCIKNYSMLTGGCYDKVYSGHFASFFMSLLLLYKNGYINTYVFIPLSTMMAGLLIISRVHYTIDIFVAFLICIIVYQNNINICTILDKYVK